MRWAVLGLLLLPGLVSAEPSGLDIQNRFGLELIGTTWSEKDRSTVVMLMERLPVELHRPIAFSKPPFTPESDDVSLLPAFKEPEPFFLARKLLRHLLTAYDREHGPSRSTAWRKLSGWKRNRLFLMRADNQDPRGYARPFGMKNPSEDFIATAMVYFLPPDSAVETSIKCRIPDKFRFIKTCFPRSVSPLDHPQIRCRNAGEGMLDDLEFLDVKTGRPIAMGPIEPESVRGFEVMYATPGAGDISEIAGHLLLRVKLNNNPEADAMGIENPHDLVISCLADTRAGRDPETNRTVVVQKECRRSNWFNLVENNPGGESALASVWQSLRGLS
ncbi:MAG: hypothetical protein AAF492_08425, partial [Verrucomicrobiota bacterium]